MIILADSVALPLTAILFIGNALADNVQVVITIRFANA
jgi:hypothetical protein